MILVLELFNYVAHHGLLRDCRADGAIEPIGPHAGSILLALIPPLWRRVMDPRIDRLEARSEAMRSIARDAEDAAAEPVVEVAAPS